MNITSIRLRPEIEEPLRNLSKKLDRSKNYLINQAVKEYIERQVMEDLRWAETLPALRSVQVGKTIPGDQVISWLESWGTDKELPKPE